ncbi:MAG: hypothetical protein K0Q79_3633, partial [Flavipsychrobacter sp.]|nr:hypothetical protein [Flavipsychrobacter sp.]MCD6013771.1 hypothetical protein [Flavipsychrobacter sp.]
MYQPKMSIDNQRKTGRLNASQPSQVHL